MNKINWIRLWLLNELVVSPCKLSHLIHPQNNLSQSYWSFPSKAAISADENDRIREVCDCLNARLINIYHCSSLHFKQFDETPEMTPFKKEDELRLKDAPFLADSTAVLTLPGHEVWENEFYPNWQRWWCLGNESFDEVNQQQVLPIMYAGNEIFDELVRWYPTYWGLDPEYGLHERSCDTIFRYQVAMWKVLPCIKIIEWTARKATWLPSELQSSLNKNKAELKAQIQHYQQSYREEGEKACQILERLSDKWGCDQDGNPVLLDG